MDELAVRRQTKCAQSEEGHVFDQASGACIKCGLTIVVEVISHG